MVLIVLVFRKLDWKQIELMLKSARPFYFLLAILLFVISQAISVFRFDLFIRNVGIRLSLKNNAQLYLLGMFYNFFLPGGVGGDAYKAYFLSKSFDKKIKKVGQVVFVERFLGIVGIGFLLSISVLFLKLPITYFINFVVFGLGIAFTFLIMKLLTRWFFIHKKRIYLGFFYSIAIQLAQLLCIFFILKAFNVTDNHFIYLVLFLLSSVLSVISFAGIGIREAVFYYGAIWFQFSSDISAAVALSFSLTTAMISVLGIIYLLKPIKLNSQNFNKSNY